MLIQCPSCKRDVSDQEDCPNCIPPRPYEVKRDSGSPRLLITIFLALAVGIAIIYLSKGGAGSGYSENAPAPATSWATGSDAKGGITDGDVRRIYCEAEREEVGHLFVDSLTEKNADVPLPDTIMIKVLGRSADRVQHEFSLSELEAFDAVRVMLNRNPELRRARSAVQALKACASSGN